MKETMADTVKFITKVSSTILHKGEISLLENDMENILEERLAMAVAVPAS